MAFAIPELEFDLRVTTGSSGGKTESVTAYAKRIRNSAKMLSSGFKSFFQPFASFVYAVEKDWFETEGKGMWEQLAPVTVARREAKVGYYSKPSSSGAAHPIHRWTDGLFESMTSPGHRFSISEASANNMRIGTKHPEATRLDKKRALWDMATIANEAELQLDGWVGSTLPIFAGR